MKPFPVKAAMFLLLSGIFCFLMGSWLFLAGILVPLPHLSVVMLLYGGCLLAFQGAIHWGLMVEKPDIILPQGPAPTEQRRIFLGIAFFLWAWVALCVGLLCTTQSGYVMEAIGFAGGFSLERVAARRGELPKGFLPIKAIFSVLVVLGFIAALISPQGHF